MPARRFLFRSVSVLVYGVAIFLGLSPFTPVSDGSLVTLPLVTTLVVIGHAARTERLDELGYAVIGLWGAVLVLTAFLGSGRNAFSPAGSDRSTRSGSRG